MSYQPFHLIQYETPTTGSTVVIDSKTEVLFLDPSGTLANLTVTFPGGPVDGEDIIVSTSQTITSLTVNGGTFNRTITTLSANGSFRFMYSSNTGTWFSVG